VLRWGHRPLALSQIDGLRASLSNLDLELLFQANNLLLIVH
jgi:hypothetical protein